MSCVRNRPRIWRGVRGELPERDVLISSSLAVSSTAAPKSPSTPFAAMIEPVTGRAVKVKTAADGAKK